MVFKSFQLQHFFGTNPGIVRSTYKGGKEYSKKRQNSRLASSYTHDGSTVKNRIIIYDVLPKGFFHWTKKKSGTGYAFPLYTRLSTPQKTVYEAIGTACISNNFMTIEFCRVFRR